MPSYRYTLGPLTWDTSDGIGHWRAPDGAVGMLDFRGLPACGEAGTSANRQVALCWFPPTAVVPADHTVLNAVPGDCREIPVTPGMRTAVMSRVGVMPSDLNGKLSGLILDLFTNKSNPEATDAVPTLESETIYMAGHSPVVSLPSDWRTLQGYRQHLDRYTLKQQLKVRQYMNDEDAGTKPLGVARKALGFLLLQHKIPGRVSGKGREWDEGEWQVFVHPVDRQRMRDRGGPTDPDTDQNDDFNRANGALGANWEGNTNYPGFAVFNNGFRQFDSGGSLRAANYASDLSGANQLTTILVGTNMRSVGPTARHTLSGTPTCYAAIGSATQLIYLYKIVSGTATYLSGGSGYNHGSSYSGQTLGCRIVGSTLESYLAGSARETITDTAIASGLRAGLASTGALVDSVGDDWSTTDVASTSTASAALTIGRVSLSGSASFTLPTRTATGALQTGAVQVASAGSVTPPVYTAASTLTVGAIQASASGTVIVPTYTATAALTLGAITLTGSGTFTAPVYTATAALITAGVTASGSAEFTAPVYSGTASLTLGAVSVAGSGTVAAPVYEATGALTVGSVTLAGLGTVVAPVYSGTASLTTGSVSLSGSGAVTDPVYSASGNLTLGGVTLAGSGSVAAPVYSGSAGLTVGAVQASGSGAVTAPVFSGTASLTTGGVSASGSGTFTSNSHTASAALTLGGTTITGSASATAPVFTGSAVLTVGPVQVSITGTTLTGTEFYTANFTAQRLELPSVTNQSFTVPAVVNQSLSKPSVSSQSLAVPSITGEALAVASFANESFNPEI